MANVFITLSVPSGATAIQRLRNAKMSLVKGFHALKISLANVDLERNVITQLASDYTVYH